MAQSAFFTFLRNGGAINANVDGSVTPVEFTYTAPARRLVHRLIVMIQDAHTFQIQGNAG